MKKLGLFHFDLFHQLFLLFLLGPQWHPRMGRVAGLAMRSWLYQVVLLSLVILIWHSVKE